MALTVYRWDDASAPQITPWTQGELKKIFDACLVNGYGAKGALGWSKPFGDNGNKTVYKMPGGTSQSYLRVDDTGTISYGTQLKHAIINSYSSMTDMDTGSDATPSTAQNTQGYVAWAYSYNVATDRPWVLIGDDSYFYLYIQNYYDNVVDNNVNSAMHFFGDIVDISSSDQYPAFISPHSMRGSTYSNIYSTWLSLPNVDNLYGQRCLDIGKLGANPYVISQMNKYNDYPYPGNRGELTTCKIILQEYNYDNAGVKTLLSASERDFRGSLPGLLYAMHSAYTLWTTNNFRNLDTINDGVNTYVLFMNYHGYYSYYDFILIKIA